MFSSCTSVKYVKWQLCVFLHILLTSIFPNMKKKKNKSFTFCTRVVLKLKKYGGAEIKYGGGGRNCHQLKPKLGFDSKDEVRNNFKAYDEFITVTNSRENFVASFQRCLIKISVNKNKTKNHSFSFYVYLFFKVNYLVNKFLFVEYFYLFFLLLFSTDFLWIPFFFCRYFHYCFSWIV